jgi:tetratricopeptide (TPR) repeat protein
VDGASDVRGIARGLMRSEFEVARTLFGLVATGIVALQDPGVDRRPRDSVGGDAGALIEAAEGRLKSGDVAAARDAALAAAALRPGEPRVHLILARAYLKEQQIAEAVEEARRAVRLDPLSLEAHRWFALALAAAGRFTESVEQFTQWERLIDAKTPSADRELIAAAKAATQLLAQLLGGASG